MDDDRGVSPRGSGREPPLSIDGQTRLIGIVGDPIAQVKAPAVLNPLLVARGLNAVLVPMRVPVERFDTVMAGLRAILNFDALVVTVPHKVAVLRHVERPSARAREVGAANVVRREPDGALAADITDGLGFVGAARAAGFEPSGRTALVVGSGGVGAAIAHALIESGAERVVVTDAAAGKAEALARRLGAVAGTPDPRGYDLVVNATPMGMRADDPLPFDPTLLSPRQFVGEVITVPEMSPLLLAARARGCRFSTGPQMVEAQAALIADFITAHMGETQRREGRAAPCR
jgi:shikimate dehydrogenase